MVFNHSKTFNTKSLNVGPNSQIFLQALSLLPQLKECNLTTPLPINIFHEVKIHKFQLRSNKSVHMKASHVNFFVNDERSILDISSLGSYGDNSIDVIGFVTNLSDMLKGMNQTLKTVGIKINHPDIFKWVHSSTYFETKSINSSVLTNPAFISKLGNDALIKVCYYYKGKKKHLSRAQLLSSQTNNEFSDLYLFDNLQVYSESAKKFVGVEQDGFIYFEARKLLESLSYNSRESGNPRLVWENGSK